MENAFQQSLYDQAQKNWKEKGSLGVTAADHEALGGTPDDILLEHPGKTLGEVMTNEEIETYIFQTRKNISENEGILKMSEFNDDLKRDLETSIQYLKDIGRLSEDFV